MKRITALCKTILNDVFLTPEVRRGWDIFFGLVLVISSVRGILFYPRDTVGAAIVWLVFLPILAWLGAYGVGRIREGIASLQVKLTLARLFTEDRYEEDH